jgi:calcium/calmodulin-dependent protein kinase I
LLPEIKQYMAKARLRRGIERVKLANRIEALKMQEDDPENTDMPADAQAAANNSHRSYYGTTDNTHSSSASSTTSAQPSVGEKKTLSKAVKGAIFREVVLAKVREMKQQEQALKVTEDAEKEAKRKSFSG